MAAELGLLSLTQLRKLVQQRKIEDLEGVGGGAGAGAGAGRSSKYSNNIIKYNNYYWMWNPKQQQSSQDEEEDDSWEVKAFEQDTGNNITWPPRSYTCTFCRREFRSAQALGGHMNVHRRDRARLHHQTVQTTTTTTVTAAASSSSSSSSSTATTALLIPAQEFGGGLCVLYSLPNPKAVTGLNSCMDSPSTTTVLSISPFESNHLVPPFPPPPFTTTTYPNYPVTTTPPQSINSSSNFHESSNTEPSSSNIISNDNGKFKMQDSTNEELDLELRLGRR